jgi:hypothetical protein
MCEGMIASKKRRQFKIVSHPPPATMNTARGGKRMLIQMTTIRYASPRIDILTRVLYSNSTVRECKVKQRLKGYYEGDKG